MGDYSIGITATTVRVPVEGGHSESVNVEFDSKFELSEIFEILAETPGVVVQDDPENSVFILCQYMHTEKMKFLLEEFAEMILLQLH